MDGIRLFSVGFRSLIKNISKIRQSNLFWHFVRIVKLCGISSGSKSCCSVRWFPTADPMWNITLTKKKTPLPEWILSLHYMAAVLPIARERHLRRNVLLTKSRLSLDWWEKARLIKQWEEYTLFCPIFRKTLLVATELLESFRSEEENEEYEFVCLVIVRVRSCPWHVAQARNSL